MFGTEHNVANFWSVDMTISRKYDFEFKVYVKDINMNIILAVRVHCSSYADLIFVTFQIVILEN